MTETRRSRCIDCGHQCSWAAYRCRPCANREKISLAWQLGRMPRLGTDGRQIIAQLNVARAVAERAERVAFIEEQLGYGFNTDDIAADLGISRNSVAKSMYRAGRPDLGRRFECRRDRVGTRAAA